MKSMRVWSAITAIAALSPLTLPAVEVVYEDTFDNDTLATNAKTGGGLVARTINTSTFGDNGDLVDTLGANNSNRGVVSTINSFDLSGGFTLEVHMNGGTGAIAQSFGLSKTQFTADTSTEDWMREQGWAGEGTSGDAYGIGIETGNSNPGASEPTPRGLKFNNGAANSTAITNLATTSSQLLPAGVNTFVLTVTPDDQFSYSYNGGAPVTGEIVPGAGLFDLSQPLFFNLYSQTDVSISYVKITALGVADTDPPMLTAANPADGSTNVTTSANLVATFNEPVVLGASGDITIKNLSNPLPDIVISLPGPDPDGTLSVAGTTLTINPTANLAPGDEYAVEITGNAIKDTSDNAYAGILSTDDPNWSFTTDGTAPSSPVLGPMAAATSVAIGQNLSLQFGETVQLGTGSIRIFLADGTPVEVIDVTSGNVIISGSGVTINPAGDLAYGQSYYVLIDSGVFTDLSGNAYAGISGPEVWTFSTLAIISGFGVLYEDNFDNDGLATNTGIGGGLVARTINTTTFGDNGDLVDTLGGNNSNRGVVSTINPFDLSNGFTLEVHMNGGTGAIAQSFGLSTTQFTSDTLTEDWMREQGWAGEGPAGDAYGIGIQTGNSNPGASEPTPRGLKLNNGAANSTAITNLVATTDNLLPAGANTFVLTVTPDDQFSYSYNGGTPVTGEIVPGAETFDLSSPLFFNLYSQSDVSISLVRITALGENPVLTISPNSTAGFYDFSWNSQTGKMYDLLTSTDLSTPVADWPVYFDGSILYENLPATGENTTLIGVPSGDSRRFFALREEDAPPIILLSEDFDSDNGSFTITKVAGTDWVWGDPDSNGPGGSVTTGNGGAGSCWGTNIGNPGYYVDPTTDSRLRSPVIDLTSVAAAELSFSHAIDIPAGDSAVVRLINSNTDTEIVSGAFPLIITDAETTSAAWQTMGPVSLPVGAPVRIEWCLTGSGDTNDDYMGWYVDDVVVVAP